MNRNLDLYKGYLAMFLFFDSYYSNHSQNDLGSFLGSANINPNDQLPMDSAMKHDWLVTVEESLGFGIKEFSAQECFHIAIRFLQKFGGTIKSEELVTLIHEIQTNEQKSDVQQRWKEAVDNALDYKAVTW